MRYFSSLSRHWLFGAFDPNAQHGFYTPEELQSSKHSAFSNRTVNQRAFYLARVYVLIVKCIYAIQVIGRYKQGLFSNFNADKSSWHCWYCFWSVGKPNICQRLGRNEPTTYALFGITTSRYSFRNILIQRQSAWSSLGVSAKTETQQQWTKETLFFKFFKGEQTGRTEHPRSRTS